MNAGDQARGESAKFPAKAGLPISSVLRRLEALLASPVTSFSVALCSRLWVAWDGLHHIPLRILWGPSEPASIARSLLAGHGFANAFAGSTQPTAWFAPALPFFLAGLFHFFGFETTLATWVLVGLNVLFSALTAAMLSVLGARLFGKRAGLFAGWLWTEWPFLGTFVLIAAETSLCALLLTLGMWAMLRLDQRASTWGWASFGAFWGIACLTNPAFMSVVLADWLWLWWRNRSVPARNKLLGVSLLAFVITLAPWLLRNYLTFGRFVFIRSDLAAEIYYANHPGLGNQPADYATFPLADATEYRQSGELNYMQEKRRQVVNYIQHHPAEFLDRTARRIWTFWTMPEQSRFGFWWIVSLLAWLGLAVAMRQRGVVAYVLGIPLMVYPIVYYLVAAFPKHRHPMDPAIILLSSFAVDSLVKQKGRIWVRFIER